jgi:hypothetical protein
MSRTFVTSSVATGHLAPESSGPISTVYARVRDKELGMVRRRVTVRTLLHPAAAYPAVQLLSHILELSLVDVRAQASGLAFELGTCVPACT